MHLLPLATLVDKYLTDSLTSEEEAAFLALLESSEERSTLRELIDEMARSRRFVSTADVAAREAGFERLLAAMDGQPQASGAGAIIVPMESAGHTTHTKGSRRLARWMVAAAMLLFSAAGWWWWRGKTMPQAIPPLSPAATVSPAVAPGGNKAILQLAGGRTIVLDSASSGLLAIQGGIRVLKVPDGSIRYQGDTALSASLYNTITTPRGGQYRLVLPDGTRVWLNAASSLRYPCAFSGPSRVVTLTGEGYFEVAQNAQQPFRVEANGLAVDVLGTRFNCMAYGDEQSIKTTLLDGAVKVSEGETQQLLMPGQQASMDRSTAALTVDRVDVDQVVAWKNGFFRFEHMDLKAIMRQISRWYDVDVRFDGEPVQDRFGGGISRSLNLDQVLHMLESGGVHYKLEGKLLRVMPGRPGGDR